MEEQEKSFIHGKADLDIIKKVKESVNINVIGNGDIVDVASALNMFEYTGCDGIMIARGAMGNPWIFKSILEAKEYIPSIEERKYVIFKHLDYLTENDGEVLAHLKARKHIAWYIKGLKSSAKIREMINTAETIEEEKEILNTYFEELKLDKE